MAKYDADELKALGAKGQAFKNPDGSFSYPVADAEDLSNAIQAVGRGNADHDAIRKYIIGRAKALGKAADIPDNWNADGSLETKSAPTDEDPEIAASLAHAKAMLARVKALQLADPDLATDPDDKTVLAEIESAEAAIDQAIVAQSKDGHEDTPEKKSARIPAQAKRGLFVDLREHEPPVVAGIQVRSSDDSPTARFGGYASTTGQGYDVTDWLGTYRETIVPTAFGKTLRETESCPFLVDHTGDRLALWRSDGTGTMDLAEDNRGLDVGADLDRRSPYHLSQIVSLERRDLDKMSFAFRAVHQTWNADYSDRQVDELQLFDVSIVQNPANPATTAGLRSEMLDVVGREGRSIMSALAGVNQRGAGLESDDLERALKVLRSVDDHIRSYRYTGRARTFIVANLLGEVRAGKVLSSANKQLLDNAVGAFTEGMSHLSTLAAAGQDTANEDTDEDEIPDDDGSEPRSNVATYERRMRALDLAA